MEPTVLSQLLPAAVLAAILVWVLFNQRKPDSQLRHLEGELRTQLRHLEHELRARLPVFSAETVRGKEAEFIRERLPHKVPRSVARHARRVRRHGCRRVVAHAVAHRDAIRVSAKAIATLDVRTRAAWHAWLEKHHGSATEIWLVFHKQHTGAPGVGYEDSIEEALCFGWVDSLVRRLDDDRYARKFTPRKPGSAWSVINRRRYASLARARSATGSRAR